MENSSIYTKISIEEVFPDALPILKWEQYYKLSKSDGLLQAVQKIIFDEWSEQLREQVHKNCLDRGAALGTAGTAVAVPEFSIISSVLGDTFHFVGKPTSLVGFWSLCFPNIKSKSI